MAVWSSRLYGYLEFSRFCPRFLEKTVGLNIEFQSIFPEPPFEQAQGTHANKKLAVWGGGAPEPPLNVSKGSNPPGI